MFASYNCYNIGMRLALRPIVGDDVVFQKADHAPLGTVSRPFAVADDPVAAQIDPSPAADANAAWASDALRALVRNFADPDVAYVCGQLRLEDADGGNREGVYWRYELLTRDAESRLGSVTASHRESATTSARAKFSTGSRSRPRGKRRP